MEEEGRLAENDGGKVALYIDYNLQEIVVELDC